MAMFFGNRPSYVQASWANQRIYPRMEPNFDQPEPTSPPRNSERRSSASSTSAFPPISRSRSTPSATSSPTTLETTSETPTATTVRPVQPPPLYFPGANRQTSFSPTHDSPSLPPNHIPSINSASTRLSIVPWSYHPIPLAPQTKSQKFKKWIRLPEIWQCLKQEQEVLFEGWPVEFGGKPMTVAKKNRRPNSTYKEGDEESSLGDRLSRLSSRRSGASRADSGVAMSRGPTMDQQQHPLEPLFRKRIQDLNEVINEGLVLSRGWLALVELMFIVWILALIVALGQGGGAQTGFLKGVEIALVLVIILSALAINGVRMRRWKLSEQLRKRTRDWSPLPITSSTNTQLMRNYLDGEADQREVQQSRDMPVMRWRLREIEGGYWIGYRPIVRCELITPATRTNPQARIEREDETEQGAGDTVRDTEGSGAMGELPPGYEDDDDVLARR